MGDNFQIEPLGENNYTSWKKEMGQLLTYKELWDVIENEAPAEPSPEWKKKDKQAFLTIYFNVQRDLREQISDNTARQAWERLKNAYPSKYPDPTEMVETLYQDGRQEKDQEILDYFDIDLPNNEAKCRICPYPTRTLFYARNNKKSLKEHLTTKSHSQSLLRLQNNSAILASLTPSCSQPNSEPNTPKRSSMLPECQVSKKQNLGDGQTRNIKFIVMVDEEMLVTKSDLVEAFIEATTPFENESMYLKSTRCRVFKTSN